MKKARAKTRRNIERSGKHGYFSEGRIRKEISKKKDIEEEVKEELWERLEKE